MALAPDLGLPRAPSLCSPGRPPRGSFLPDPDHTHGPGPPLWTPMCSLPVSASFTMTCGPTCARPPCPVTPGRCCPPGPLGDLRVFAQCPPSRCRSKGPCWAPVQRAPCEPQHVGKSDQNCSLHRVPTLCMVVSVSLPSVPPPRLPGDPTASLGPALFAPSQVPPPFLPARLPSPLPL